MDSLLGLGLALQNLAAQALRPFHTGVGVDPEEDEGACVGRRLSVPLLPLVPLPRLVAELQLVVRDEVEDVPSQVFVLNCFPPLLLLFHHFGSLGGAVHLQHLSGLACRKRASNEAKHLSATHLKLGQRSCRLRINLCSLFEDHVIRSLDHVVHVSSVVLEELASRVIIGVDEVAEGFRQCRHAVLAPPQPKQSHGGLAMIVALLSRLRKHRFCCRLRFFLLLPP